MRGGVGGVGVGWGGWDGVGWDVSGLRFSFFFFFRRFALDSLYLLGTTRYLDKSLILIPLSSPPPYLLTIPVPIPQTSTSTPMWRVLRVASLHNPIRIHKPTKGRNVCLFASFDSLPLCTPFCLFGLLPLCLFAPLIFCPFLPFAFLPLLPLFAPGRFFSLPFSLHFYS